MKNPATGQPYTQNDWTAARLVYSYLAGDEIDDAWEAAWADIGAGDDEEVIERLRDLVDLLSAWVAEDMRARLGKKEALARARAEIFRSAPAGAKLLAAIEGAEVPLRSPQHALDRP